MRALFVFLGVLACSIGQADGTFVGSIRSASPEQPYQRALLKHKDGEETLIVESMVRANEPELVWLLPIPGKPKNVEAVSPGTMESMSRIVAPRVDGGFETALVMTAVLFVASLGVFATKPRTVASLVVRFLAVLGFLSAISIFFFPVFAGYPSKVNLAVPVKGPIGSYDVTQLDSLIDAESVGLTDGATQVLKRHMKEGWTVLRFQLRNLGKGVMAPHPVKVVFEAKKPVYPMSLTLANTGPVVLDLYFLSDFWASCLGSSVWWTSEPFSTNYGDREPGPDEPQLNYIPVSHPEVAPLFWKGCTLTRFHGEYPRGFASELSPAFVADEPERPWFARKAAVPQAIISLLLLWSAAVLFTGTWAGIKHKSGEPQFSLKSAGLCLSFSLFIYTLVASKYEVVDTETHGRYQSMNDFAKIRTSATTLAQTGSMDVRADLKAQLPGIEEKDVPGGYVVRDEPDGWAVTAYDRLAAAWTYNVRRTGQQPTTAPGSKSN